MKNSKRLMYVLLAVVFIFYLTGCSASSVEDPVEDETTITSDDTTKTTTTEKQTKKTTKEEKTKKQTEEEIKNPLAEKFEITWLGPNTATYEEGRWDELELEEKFNVDFKIWNIDNHDTEQIMMMLSAGDFPDFCKVQYWDTEFLYESKLIRTVPKDMIYEYLPTYASYRDAEAFSWDMRLVEGTEDEYYGLMASTPQDTFPWTYSMFRLDWLENLGYEFPNLDPIDDEGQIFITERQFSFDELNSIYREFTEDDPDGNGEDDTYARLYIGLAEWEGNISGMFGVVPVTKYIYKDPATGDYVDYRAYTGMRDYWEWLTDGIEKGYIHSRDFSESWATQYQDLLAIPNVGHINPPAFAVRSAHASHLVFPPNVVLKENPDVTMVITPPPQGPSGKGNMYVRYFSKWSQGALAYFSAETSDAELARIFQILEYTCFGENVLRYTKGIEGIHFKWEGEPLKSMIIETPLDKIPPKYSNGSPMKVFNPGVFNMTMYTYLGMGFRYENFALEEYWNANNWLERFALVPDKNIDWTFVSNDLEDRLDEIYEDVGGDIGAVYNDFTKRMFEGQIGDIKAEWSQYVNALYDAGYDRIVEVYNDETWPLTVDIYKGSSWVKK